MGEWLNKLVYMNSMEYDSAIKRKGMVYTTWINLWRIIVNEKSHFQKVVLWFHLYNLFWKKILEMESRLEACTVVEHEKMEVSVVFKGQCQGF